MPEPLAGLGRQRIEQGGGVGESEKEGLLVGGDGQ
ncbi:hypothetical protein HOV93_13250 [Planctomycetes bacterium FF15]|uniref:Uncharacterized protein n=1 Tax=Bremerella alba TaxID=980252 RepID=A0A7V8V3B4_9BACT|nr:hypothetical protein [Bremerella alba]